MVELVRFSILNGLTHGLSTRAGGVSPVPYATLNMSYGTEDEEGNVAANRQAFFTALGISSDAVMSGRCTHENGVSTFRTGDPGEWPVHHGPVKGDSSRTQALFLSDAVVSDVAGLYFLLTFADCVPLAFWDRRRGAVGAAHAGWRGTALQIGPATVRTMQKSFGSHPRDLVAVIGPSIGPCCYEIQDDVVHVFAAQGSRPAIIRRNGRAHLDLWATNRRQLRDAGIPAESIESSQVCTACNTDRFYSHRAERGRTGRFALCLGLE